MTDMKSSTEPNGVAETSSDETAPEKEAVILHDLEPGRETREGKPSEPVQDPNIVTWQGKDDPQNPKNWPKNKKWAATFVSLTQYPLGPTGCSLPFLLDRGIIHIYFPGLFFNRRACSSANFTRSSYWFRSRKGAGIQFVRAGLCDRATFPRTIF